MRRRERIDSVGNLTDIKPNDINKMPGKKVSPSTPIIPRAEITKNTPIPKNIPQPMPENIPVSVNNFIESTPSPIAESPTVTEEDDSNQRFLARLLGQGVAMFGAGIAGRDPMKVAEQFNEQQFYSDRLAQSKENEKYNRAQREDAIKQAKLLMNPSSEVSKRKRLIYEKSLGIKIPQEFSASDLEDRNVLQGLIAQYQPKPVLGRGGGGGQPKPVKETKNPFQKEITEVNIKSKNTIDALDELENLVSKYGTTELFGAEANTMQQLIDSIATDYNKIKDPTSTVRGDEADRVRASLGLGGISGIFTSKPTAIKQIQNFKNMVKKQRDVSLSQYKNPNAVDINSTTDIDFMKEK